MEVKPALLDERAGCRVLDLAEEFRITVGGISKVVDRIEAAGYCRRRANPGDHRSSIVELTASGRRVLTKAAKVFGDELEIRHGSPPVTDAAGVTFARLEDSTGNHFGVFSLPAP
jgi:DNA-binding MarR family transcriptional regulator